MTPSCIARKQAVASSTSTRAQVALGDGTKGRVTLRVRVSGGDPEEEDEQPELGDEIIIAVLEHGKAESQTLDLVFDTYAEFTATGGEVRQGVWRIY